MDIQALKLELVERIIRTEKPTLLNKINNILKKETDQDWWDTLPPEIQESILSGLKDVEDGNVFTHEQVLKEARQKYGF